MQSRRNSGTLCRIQSDVILIKAKKMPLSSNHEGSWIAAFCYVHAVLVIPIEVIPYFVFDKAIPVFLRRGNAQSERNGCGHARVRTPWLNSDKELNHLSTVS